MLEYTVEAEQVVANVSTARSKRAQIFFDSSPGQSEHLLNPAELLLSAFSVCMLKNVERLAPLLRFSYTRTALQYACMVCVRTSHRAWCVSIGN